MAKRYRFLFNVHWVDCGSFFFFTASQDTCLALLVLSSHAPHGMRGHEWVLYSRTDQSGARVHSLTPFFHICLFFCCSPFRNFRSLCISLYPFHILIYPD